MTRNKLHALFKLNFEAQQLAVKFTQFEWNGWGPGGNYDKYKNDIASNFDVHTLADLFTAVAPNPAHILALEWIGDCPMLDELIYQAAAARGYDCVQFYRAGYQGCYWANEIMCVAPETFEQLVASRVLTTAGPCLQLADLQYLACGSAEHFDATFFVCISLGTPRSSS